MMIMTHHNKSIYSMLKELHTLYIFCIESLIAFSYMHFIYTSYIHIICSICYVISPFIIAIMFHHVSANTILQLFKPITSF